MAGRGETIGRLVGRAHRRLDALFVELRDALAEGEEHRSLLACAARLREAMEEHLDQEDELFWPAVRALDPEMGRRLRGFAEEHPGLRARIVEIHAKLSDGAPADALPALDALAEDFAAHEAGEEALVAVIGPPRRGGDDTSR